METRPEPEHEAYRVQTGIREIDEMLDADCGGLVLLLGEQRALLPMASSAVARCIQGGGKVLYLHFLDYHDRYWSLNVDSLIELAKSLGVSYDTFVSSMNIVRAFTTDQIEDVENWKRIEKSLGDGKGYKLVVMDSLSDLYGDSKQFSNPRMLLRVIGQLKSLCLRFGLTALVLDYSQKYFTYYVPHSSAVVMRLERHGDRLRASLLKHPSMECRSVEFAVPSRQGVLRMKPVRKLGLWGWAENVGKDRGDDIPAGSF
jgi:hypothetical protein